MKWEKKKTLALPMAFFFFFFAWRIFVETPIPLFFFWRSWESIFFLVCECVKKKGLYFSVHIWFIFRHQPSYFCYNTHSETLFHLSKLENEIYMYKKVCCWHEGYIFFIIIIIIEVNREKSCTHRSQHICMFETWWMTYVENEEWRAKMYFRD
jgi:hypothetical protein